MRLRSLSFRGITRFASAEPVSIDFDEIGPGLVALVGRNGEGKTTAMEATPVALFKSFPSRPGFYENFSGRDAFVEAIFDDAGHELRVHLSVDAVKRTTEGYVFRDGVSLTTGRAAAFEFTIAEHFGSYQLFMSSVFACQTKAGSFLGMKKSERKDLFVELLGLGALQVLAESARQRGTSADVNLERHRTTLTSAEQESAGLSAAVEVFVAAQQGADAAAQALDDARSEEGAAIKAHERAKSAGERITALADAERSARTAYVHAENVLAIANRGPKQAQDRRDERLSAILARGSERMAQRAVDRHVDAVKALGLRREALEAQLRDVPDADLARGSLRECEEERSLIVELAKAARTLDEKIASAKRKRDESADVLGRAQRAHADEIAALRKQASRLTEVPCTTAIAWAPGNLPGAVKLSAMCPLLSDARQAADKANTMEAEGAEIFAPREALFAAASRGLDEAVAERDALPPVPTTDDVDSRIERSRADVAKALAAVHARDALANIDTERAALEETLKKDLAAAQDASFQAMKDREAAEAKYETELMEADEACQVAGEAMKRASLALHDAVTALNVARAEGGDVEKAKADASLCAATRSMAEEILRRRDQDRATAHAKVEQLRERAARLPELQAAVQLAEQEVGDWTLLTKSLGRDGVQALEIDAAGPEVATLTNELLAACYGPRFSITFETLAVKRDGGQKEVFDVRVYDGAAERPVEALSGGEKVVVGEAIGLAIAIFNARKSGVRWETLFRDETAGALDVVNAQAYLVMLRRARELGQFSQVLFVAHQPEIFEGADVRLIVAGGTIVADTGARAAA